MFCLFSFFLILCLNYSPSLSRFRGRSPPFRLWCHLPVSPCSLFGNGFHWCFPDWHFPIPLLSGVCVTAFSCSTLVKAAWHSCPRELTRERGLPNVGCSHCRPLWVCCHGRGKPGWACRTARNVLLFPLLCGVGGGRDQEFMKKWRLIRPTLTSDAVGGGTWFSVLLV